MTDKEKIVFNYVLEANRKAREALEKPFDKHKNRITNRNRLKGSMQQTERFLVVLSVAFAENTTAKTVSIFKKEP